MDNTLKEVLAEYEHRAAEESKLMRSLPAAEMQKHRDELLISVGPDTGQLLNILAKASKAKRIVELGASYGYSAHWLADAARANGGKVTSLEIHAGKVTYAKTMLARAELDSYVEFVIGDARESLQAMSGSIDFLLIDLWKDLYPACLELAYPKLSPGAIVVADNMLYPEHYRAEALAYRQLIKSKPHITSVLLPVGSGIEVSRYRGE